MHSHRFHAWWNLCETESWHEFWIILPTQTINTPCTRIDSTHDEICAKWDQIETKPFSFQWKMLLKQILILIVAVHHFQIYETHSKNSSHRFHHGWNLCETGPIWDIPFFAFKVDMNFESSYIHKQSKVRALA